MKAQDEPPLLELTDLRYRWARDKPVLLEIPRLAIDKGQHLFLMGPSGSGKSTLLNLVGGVIQPEQGTIRLDQQDMTALGSVARDRLRANEIGYIFQQFNLIPYLNAQENVALPCRFSIQRRRNAEKTSGSVHDEALRLLGRLFPRGAADLHQRVDRLSVGQQQRVAAARALIGKPRLIIADEPTSSLDHDSRLRFMQLLLDEADVSGATVLFVSHDPTLQRGFTRSLNLDEINTSGATDGTV